MNMEPLWILALTVLNFLPLQASSPTSQKDQITVYIFLHEACIISQYYTLPLRQMHEEYACENLEFVGLFPNPTSTAAKVEAFGEKYRVPFSLETDHHHHLVEALGASVTPEVVVYNQTTSQILYKGRIDDAYARVGQRKRSSATSELRDVLTAIAQEQPINVPPTKAVGCYIGTNKLN